MASPFWRQLRDFGVWLKDARQGRIRFAEDQVRIMTSDDDDVHADGAGPGPTSSALEATRSPTTGRPCGTSSWRINC